MIPNLLPLGQRLIPFLVLASLLPLATYGERVEDVPNPRERDSTWVTDLPGALSSDTVGRLNRLIDGLERETSDEIAVVVVQNLSQRTIEDFANELFNRWGIGKRETDNGVLLLWALDERRVRIEVGTGLEGKISDSRAGGILDGYVIPRFKQGEFDEGVLAGVEEIATILRGGPTGLPAEAGRDYTPGVSQPMGAKDTLGTGGPGSWISPIWAAIAGLAGTIGSLFGFKRWRRHRKRFCPACDTQMIRLAEDADDAHLQPPGRLEERLGSVDYDVWQCPSCSHSFTLRYPKWFTSYSSCPQCSNKTRTRVETTIRSATTSSTGRAKVTEDCEFCTYHQVYYRTIPRKSSSSSSSSFGSSSFGGGSSSGGGASRGY